jgi:hypothetical protein
MAYIQINKNFIDDKPLIDQKSKQELLDFYEDKTTYIYGYNKKVGKYTYQKVPFIKEWFKDPNKKKYRQIVFKPYEVNDEKVFNLFKGFMVKYDPDYELEEGGRG